MNQGPLNRFRVPWTKLASSEPNLGPLKWNGHFQTVIRAMKLDGLFGRLWFQTFLDVIRTSRILYIGGVIRHVNDFFCSIVFSLISNRIQNFEKFKFPFTDSTVWIGSLETSSYFPFIKGTDPDCYFNRTHDSISLQYLSLSFYFWLETKRRDDALV